MSIKIVNRKYDFEKVGVNEIQGLKNEMMKLMKPIQKQLKESIYWSGVDLEESEYKSRDGFIPHSGNCGGIEISEIIPECEKYDFGFLEFGEWDGTHWDCKDRDACDCSYLNDGELDAKLRIWFKFEGYDSETGELKFWLYMGGGNGDAPYFRTKYENDIFEASFSCKSVKGLNRAASKHIKKLVKMIKDGK